MEYAKLPNAQKWQWHAEVYAMRRVMLGVGHDEHTSPVDPKGEWFDGQLVDAAEGRMRAKYEDLSRQCREHTVAENAIRFADAERWRNSEEGRRYLAGMREAVERRGRAA